MNILLLNWRDIKNPTGGGAEILTHEILKRLVKKGNTVTQFSSFFSKAKKEEIIDGVKFIRRGKWYTVHFFAFIYYLRNRSKFDVIIDEVHWFPFFAVLYAPKKTIALTCEVASKLFFVIFPRPIAYIFLYIERLYLFLYRNVPTMVISQSTYDSLIKSGHNKKNIIIIPMGINVPNDIEMSPKEKIPIIISVGRLNQQKGTLDTLNAFRFIHNEIPDSKLWLIGSGKNEFIHILKKHIGIYKLEKNVTLWGYVTEKEKFNLLGRAWVQISASNQEGWGLTIPEAGIMKTPSVVYNIEGFRDIIESDKTGILVDNNSHSLGKETIKLLKDPKRYTRLQNAVYIHSKKFSWESTVDVAEKLLLKITK